MAKPILIKRLIDENPFPLKDGKKWITGAPSPTKVRSWVYQGCVPAKYRCQPEKAVGKKDGRIYLEVIRLTSGLCTSLPAYQRFIKKLNS